MARKFRDNDDLDDDDDRPGRRRRHAEPGASGMALWLGLSLGVGVLVVGGLLVLLLSSRKKPDDTAQTPPDQQPPTQVVSPQPTQPQPRPQPRPEPPRKTPDTPSSGTASNWSKVVGRWTRTRSANETGGYPYYIEFRSDQSVKMTRSNAPGSMITHQARAEVQLDQGEILALTLRVASGTYSYSFRVKPDGTLVLDDGKGGLVFTRQK